MLTRAKGVEIAFFCLRHTEASVLTQKFATSSLRATPAKAGATPESRNFKSIWIPASTGMTARRDELIVELPGQDQFIHPYRLEVSPFFAPGVSFSRLHVTKG